MAAIFRNDVMQGPVLVICLGNICRSPLGAQLLRRLLPGREISSAGLAASEGSSADPAALRIAAEAGIDLSRHQARRLTGEIGAAQALILVMEPGQRLLLMQEFPPLSGRIFLFDHWTGACGIPDPRGRSDRFHRAVRDRLAEAAAAWADRLGRLTPAGSEATNAMRTAQQPAKSAGGNPPRNASPNPPRTDKAANREPRE